MRGPLTRFLLLMTLAAIPGHALNAQGTRKSQGAGSLKKAVQDYETRLTRLEATLQRKRNDASKDATRGSAATRATRDLAQRAAEQRRQAAQAMARAQRAVTSLQESLAKAGNENQALASKLAAQQAAHSELTDKHDQLLNLHKQSEAANAAATTRAAKANQTLARAEKRSEDLQQQLTKERAGRAELQDRYAEISARHKKAEASLSQAREEVSVIKTRSQQLTSSLAAQTEAARSAERARADLQAQVAAQAKTADRSREALAEARRQVTALKSQLSAAHTRPAPGSIDARLTKAEASLQESRRLLQETRKQARSLAQAESQRAALSELVKTLRAELAAARSANDTLRESLRDRTPPPSRQQGSGSSGDDTRGIHIYNQGGTVIIKQGASKAKAGGSSEATVKRKRSNAGSTNKSKQGANKKRRGPEPTTKRRINS